MYAVRNEKLKTVELLFDKGADASEKTMWRATVAVLCVIFESNNVRAAPE